MTHGGLNFPRPDAPSLVHEKVLALLLNEKPGLLLDVPTGEGAFAAKARELGHEVICGDLDVSRFNVPSLQCDQVDLNARWPYSNAQFDYVVSIEAIEHLENPWHMAREANRVLKMGGRFLLTTPNVLSIRSRFSYLLYGYPNYFYYMIEQSPCCSEERPVDHINPIGFLELRHILSRTGLHIEAIESNRLLKQRSVFFQLIRLLLLTRGRSHVRNHEAKASVRRALLSTALLFGEVLVLKARKVHDPNAWIHSKESQ